VIEIEAVILPQFNQKSTKLAGNAVGIALGNSGVTIAGYTGHKRLKSKN
jgi:hypothetical protein